MMVSCILLNQTSNKQVRPILEDLFDLIPNPETARSIDPSEISNLIRSTGLYNIKAERIIKMSSKWIEGFSDPSELPGIGKYGRDSWYIFVDNKYDITPTDKKLLVYLEALQLVSN